MVQGALVIACAIMVVPGSNREPVWLAVLARSHDQNTQAGRTIQRLTTAEEHHSMLHVKDGGMTSHRARVWPIAVS